MSNADTDRDIRRKLVSDMVDMRKDWGIRQVDIAEKMGIGQPSVSEFERGETDPKLSTIQRYATAIGVTLKMELEWGDKE